MKALSILATVALLAGGVGVAEGEVWLQEQFEHLDRWRPLTFPKIKRHSDYAIVEDGTNRYVKAMSVAAASGLVLKETYNITEYPRLRWRWKADNVYAKGNAARKSGDDYPLRVYVFFSYDPGKANLKTRAMFALAKARLGDYPPHSTINYIWGNQLSYDERAIPDAYTARAMMIPLRCSSDVGEWCIEEVNVLEDYREAFGSPPPPEACLAIMCDSDDTGEAAVSYIDFIEVLR